MDRTNRLVAALAVAFFALSLLTTTAADAARPLITSSSATNTTLTIRGQNLGPGVPSVLLGKTGRLTVLSQTPSKLVVALPLTRMPIGNYLVSVQVGENPTDVDESVVTLGMACDGVVVFEGDESFCNRKAATSGTFGAGKASYPGDVGLCTGSKGCSGCTGGGCSGCTGGGSGCSGCAGCRGD
jgi:hypothetical protein